MHSLLRSLVALLALVGAVVLVDAAPAAAAEPPDVVTGVAAAALPALARDSLPLISDLTASTCPELPPVWVVAQVQAESGWDAGARSDRPGGAAGLYQLGQSAWVAAGGSPWASDPPADGAGVLSPGSHLRVAIPWVCANLRAVTAHLAATGKPTTPLDAMLVCHVAGCARVTDSRTGVPAAGEAGCDERCAQLVQRYIAAVHDNVVRFAAPLPPAASPAGGTRPGTARNGTPSTPSPRAPTDATRPQVPGAPTASAEGYDGPSSPVATGAPSRAPGGQVAVPPVPPLPTHGSAPAAARPPVPALLPDGPGVATSPTAWAGGATRCTPPDPTSSGCLTGATRHGLDAVGDAFGGWRGGPVVHSTGCWDRHAWNPTSDHSRGKACDFMVTGPGTFAKGAELDNGWALAGWLRANAGTLQVKYLIWQGRYWDPSVHDDPGSWGSRYTGAGIYDVRTATGGHFDHVHASFRE